MPLVGHAWNRPAYGFTAEDLLGTLDAHGVHFAVIAGISLYGTYNDYMIEKLRQYPRLRGTANLSTTVDRMELRDMADAGVIGMRVFQSSQTAGTVADIKSDDYQRLFRRVRDLDWHIHFLAQDDNFEDVLATLQATGVKLVVDHFSSPGAAYGPDNPKVNAALRAMDSGKVWMKISSGFRFAGRQGPRSPDDYKRAHEREKEYDDYVISRAGTERLLWGSDCPFVGHEGEVAYGDVIASFHNAVPDARVRRAISDTALKFYFS